MRVAKRITTAFGARAEVLRFALFALSIVLSGWALVVDAATIPVRSGSAGRTSWNVQTSNLDSVINATNASVQIGRDIIANIGYGGKQIGSVAAMEVSAIGIADMAAVVARASGPVMIAMMVGDLARRGLERCMESGTGWCKRAPANPSEGDDHFDGAQWGYQGIVVVSGDSPAATCRAGAEKAGTSGGGMGATPWEYAGLGAVSDGPTFISYKCLWKNNNFPNGWDVGAVGHSKQSPTCVSGYVLSGGQCVVDTSKPVNWLPASYPDVAAAWNAQMAANPNRIPDYWKQMSPDEQASAEQSAQRQPTQMKGTDTVSDPNVSTSTETSTKADGTQQQCTTTTGVRVQARPNSGPSAASSPLNYQTTSTTTRTCPDGTTTTVENSDSGDTQPRGGGGSRPEVKMCGLADTAPCKIDEKGTPTAAEGKVAIDVAGSQLTQTRQDAQANFTSVNAGRSFDLHMPHLLPGGTCQPVEWFSWGSWRGTWDPCESMAYVRILLSWLWYTLAAIYIWNRTASANAGAQ
jgi:hypothetical protein